MSESETHPSHRGPSGLNRGLLRIRASELRDKLTKRLIRLCQQQSVGVLSAFGFKNLWEEICIAVRQDHPLRGMYEDHLETHLTDLVVALPVIDQQTLWLVETYASIDWPPPPEFPDLAKHMPPEDLPWPPTDWPIVAKGIARQIIHESVLYECHNYDNARIRAYEGR